ncbi:MAG: MATE family efflux transporter [Planctomycetaceae bacterium]
MSERGHAPGSFRELFVVSLPLIISAGSHSLMNIADRIMLAGYQPANVDVGTALDVIAAVTPAGMLHWTVACIPLGTILYANTFISQFDGANKPRELAASLWQCVWLAIISGLLLILLIPFSSSVFTLAGHSPNMVAQESAYFNTLCAGSVLLLTSNALGCFFSGRQKTLVVMWVNMVSVFINVVMDYALIYGHWGLPEMGITGAAAGTLLARACDIVMFVALMILHGRRSRYPLRSTWRPDVDMLKKYLRFGVPSGLHYFVDNSGFLAFLFIVGSLSRDDMAATNLAFSVNAVIFVPLLGFGTAVQTLVGHHIGANLPAAAVRTTWNAVRMGMVWTGAAAILLVYFPEASLRPFLAFTDGATDNGGSIRAILPTASRLLRFVAIYSIFDAMAVVFASALRGAGDTLFPMLITMCSSWLVMTLPAWLIVRSEGATIQQLWLTCTAHIMLMGSAMLLRFLAGKWKTIHLVSNDQ